MNKKMTKQKLIILLYKEKIKFLNQNEKKSVEYINKKLKLSFWYTVEYCPNQKFKFDIDYITTDKENQFFYGFSSQYGHKVYINSSFIFDSKKEHMELLEII